MSNIFKYVKSLFSTSGDSLHNNFLLVVMLTFLLSFTRFFYEINNMETIKIDTLIIMISLYLIIGYFFTFLLLFLVDKLKYISKKFSLLTLNFIFLLTITLFIIDIFLLHEFNGILDQTKISIIFSADPYTDKEFLLTYLISNSFISVIIFIIIAFLITIRTKLNKKSLLEFLYSERLNKWSKPCFFGSLIILFFILKSAFNDPEKEYILKQIFCMSSSINRLTLDIYSAIKDMGIEQEVFRAFEKNPEFIIENKCNMPYVIFILGESADRNKMHAYGYKVENTPNLDKRIRNGETILFTDTIAPANHTTLAMEYIFTFYNKESKNKWYDNQNFIDILKSSGYHVSFISNQSPINLFGNMDDLLSKRASQKFFTEYSGGNSGELKKCIDGEILPILNDILNKNTHNNQFYIIHIEGSHEPYSERYPNEFDKFSDEHIEECDNFGEYAKTIRAQYANSILYTDYIIEEIIKKFESKDCLLIYFSDHGSDVYDGKDFFGHSDESLRSKNMVEIPFVIWGSNTFWNKRPILKEQILNAKDKPYMTDDFIHLLLDIMNIKTTSYEPNRSVINKEYNEKRVRLYGGKPYSKYD